MSTKTPECDATTRSEREESRAERLPQKRAERLPRHRSPSSSSTSSSSSSSSEDSRRKKKKNVKSSNDRKFESLTNQVSEILSYLKNNDQKFTKCDQGLDSESDISLHPSDNLKSSLLSEQPFLNKPQNQSQPPTTAKSFEFDLNTNLKEPTVENSNETRLDLLTKLHHFNSDKWERVRYVETEKKYLARPGFYELDVNTELRYYDPNSTWLKSLDRSLGAMTHALIQQNTLLKGNLQEIIQWSYSTGTTLNPECLFEKINSLFSEKTEYMKVSEDLLQLVCGRRADVIQKRRDSILSGVKDRFIKEDLRKIPPTNNSLFNADSLGTFLQKAGGTNKIFSANKRSAEEPIMSMRNRPEHSQAKRPRRSYRKPEAETERAEPSTSYQAPKGNKSQKQKGNKSGTKRGDYKKSNYNNSRGNRFQK